MDNCRESLIKNSQPYPKSGCAACGWTPFNDNKCLNSGRLRGNGVEHKKIQFSEFSHNNLTVKSELFGKPVDIVKEISSLAAQENCDDHEYDMLHIAARYITYLRNELKENE